MIELHLEILDEQRNSMWNKLRSFSSVGVLGGGTGLALQLGHRKSYDFDVMISTLIQKSLWVKAKKEFGNGCLKTLDSEDQLSFVTPENIAITFLYCEDRFLFPSLKSSSIDLLDIRDIAAEKAMTIGRRGKWRDYADIYSLLVRDIISLPEICEWGQRRFGGGFSKRLFLQQLVYFDDIPDFTIEWVGTEIDPEEIKRFLCRVVKEEEEKDLIMPVRV